MKISGLTGETRLGANSAIRRGKGTFSVAGGGSDRIGEVAEATNVEFGNPLPVDANDEDSARRRALLHCQESIGVLASLQRMCAEGIVDAEHIAALARCASELPAVPAGDPLREILERIQERLSIELAKLCVKGYRE